MRKTFESYYPPTDEFFDQLWENALVVLDTNVLLDMYRYSENTRKDFLSLFSRLADRLWLPHQVAFEFSRNRPDVIATQVQMYHKARQLLSSLRDTATKEIEKILSFRLHPVLSREEFQSAFDAPLAELEKKIDGYAERHPDFFQQDPILEALLNLFEGKVGKPYNTKRLDEILQAGKDRYAREVPPGYEDARGPGKKEGDAIYGDLILWFQTMDHAKEVKSPGVILLSNDMKEDWWWFSKGRNLGCRPELREEMREESGTLFYMYTSERFLHFAPERIKVDVSEESIDEVRSLEQENREARERQAGAFVSSTLNRILADQKRRDQLVASLQTPAFASIIEEQRKNQEALNRVLRSNIGQSSAVTRAIEQIRKQEQDMQRMLRSIPEPTFPKLIADFLGEGGKSLTPDADSEDSPLTDAETEGDGHPNSDTNDENRDNENG
jgi:hypothetical protein